MDSVYRRVALVLMLMFTFAFTSPFVVLATDLDAIQSQTEQTQDIPSSNYNEYGSGYSDGNAISDYLKGYTPITQENMATASKTMSPIVSFLGTLSGCIVMFASAGIFVVTALDLCYIGLPFTRGWLNPQYNMAGGAAMGGGMPMGGYGGMGMGRMGMGGMMGGGMMGGGAQPAQEFGIRRKWVSDEAVQCVNMYANGAMPQGGMSPMGGMGMGMGGGMMGGGMMGGGMGSMQTQQPIPTRSVIMEYFKKRVFFMIVFAVCTVMLMSSIFTDCGINLAELLTKVLMKVNGEISTLNV